MNEAAELVKMVLPVDGGDRDARVPSMTGKGHPDPALRALTCM